MVLNYPIRPSNTNYEVEQANKAQHCFLFDIEGMTVLKGTTMFQKAAQHFATKPQNFGF